MLGETQIRRSFRPLFRGLRDGSVGSRVEIGHNGSLVTAVGVVPREDLKRKSAPLTPTVAHDGELCVGEAATRIRAPNVVGEASENFLAADALPGPARAFLGGREPCGGNSSGGGKPNRGGKSSGGGKSNRGHKAEVAAGLGLTSIQHSRNSRQEGHQKQEPEQITAPKEQGQRRGRAEKNHGPEHPRATETRGNKNQIRKGNQRTENTCQQIQHAKQRTESWGERG